MYDGAFMPKGPTVLVGVNAVQAPNTDGTSPTSCRVRNILSTAQYLTWAPRTNSVPTITATAPSASTPAVNTMGFAAGSTETVIFPPNCWFKADAAAAFEVTPGEGV